MNEGICSPLTGRPGVEKIGEIDPLRIIQCYGERLNLDVSAYFEELETVDIYECQETGYRFYSPLDLMGDDLFYQELSKQPWYYLPWKWEHAESLDFIEDGMKVLEVGCGRGGFLENLKKQRQVTATGLELNQEAVKNAPAGVEILAESVERHAEFNAGTYDFVCSYQVLEHISNVRDVLQAMVNCLKPGGRILISVPNNDGFIGENAHPAACLNMPPHHMGLWGEKSLARLPEQFPIRLVHMTCEPLQEIHFGPYQHTLLNRYIGKLPLAKSIYFKLRLNKIMESILRNRAKKIRGHSVLVVYEAWQTD